MATVKVKFRPSTVEGKEGTLYYRIIHNRQSRQLRTGYKLYPREWDPLNGCILAEQSAPERKTLLLQIQERILTDTDRLLRIIDTLESSARTYCHADILNAYLQPDAAETLFGFMHEMIARLELQGRMRTAETYATTMHSFARFRNHLDVDWKQIDSELMAAYEAYLRQSGISKNSSSFYMRILRAVYNRAVERGLTPQRQPFKHVYTGVDKTVKRTLTLETIRRIRNVDLHRTPQLEYARDMFLMSFYTRGMSFVDMAYLRKRDLTNGVLTYRRKKTGQRLTIRWEPCMEELLAKYPHDDPNYLLPIIRTDRGDERRQYKNVGHLINRSLKRLGRDLDLSFPLTMYCARHTWANVARDMQIPLAVISEGMGHDSEKTTRIYLTSLDSSIVDRANRMVIDSLRKKRTR